MPRSGFSTSLTTKSQRMAEIRALEKGKPDMARPGLGSKFAWHWCRLEAY
jgi:hypothetical protein